MSLPLLEKRIARFGIYEADLEQRILTKSGLRVKLQDQPFQVLALLLERSGEIVSRDEIRQRLWPGDTFVEFDDGLNNAIKKLRASLGDVFENPRFIETVPRRGYRFVATVNFPRTGLAPVMPVSAPPPPATPEPMLAPTHDRNAGAESRHFLWLAIGVVVLLALVLGFVEWRGRSPVAPIDSIAVLPLQNLSNDAAQEYFADGMTDEIITGLAKLSGLKVISRTSAMQYKATHKSIPQIAKELNVGAIVEGSIERSRSRMRLRVQLIEGSTDHHLWAEEYDRELGDVLNLKTDVAHDIAEQIKFHLIPQERGNLLHARNLNPQAFEDYLQGRNYWALRTLDSLVKAVGYFNRAIQEDPNDARSYAGLAQCYIVFPFFNLASENDSYPKARDAAFMALRLDDSLADAHLAIAEVHLYLEWNFLEADKEFKKTLELNPSYSTGHQWYGEFLSLVGRHPEAIHEEQAALVLDPLSAIVHHQAANVLRDAGYYDEALPQYHEALKLNPDFFTSYEAMSWAFRRQGKFADSIQVLRTAGAGFRIAPEIVPAINALQSSYAAGGRAGYLRQCLKVHRYYTRPAYYLARDYAGLGERDAAFAELMRAYQDRDAEILWLLNDPEMDPLRSDPRFQQLARAIGFPS